jgi:hypothetical protein
MVSCIWEHYNYLFNPANLRKSEISSAHMAKSSILMPQLSLQILLKMKCSEGINENVAHGRLHTFDMVQTLQIPLTIPAFGSFSGFLTGARPRRSGWLETSDNILSVWSKMLEIYLWIQLGLEMS